MIWAVFGKFCPQIYPLLICQVPLFSPSFLLSCTLLPLLSPKIQKRRPIISPSYWYHLGYQDFLSDHDNQEPILLLEKGMEMEKEELRGGYGTGGGSSSGERKEVDVWLHHMLSWMLLLDMRCDWNRPDSLERTDPVVMWFIWTGELCVTMEMMFSWNQ